MFRDLRSSIRGDLFRSLFLSLILLYGLGALAVYLTAHQSLNRQFDQNLRLTLERLATLPLVGSHSEPDNRRQRGFQTVFESNFCQLWDEQGETLRKSILLENDSLRFPSDSSDEVTIAPVVLPDGSAGKVGSISFEIVTRTREDLSQGSDVDPTIENASIPDPVAGRKVTLSVAMPSGEMRGFLRTLAIALLLTGVAMVSVLWWVVRFQLVRGFRPLDELALLTGSIRAEQLDQRLPSEGLKAELQPLVHEFNTLLERLEEAFLRERSFSASLAHEIRTPLAELTVLVGNALADSGEVDPSENAEEVYREADQVIQHMVRLVEAISSLHQADSGRELVKRETIDLGTLVESKIDQHKRTHGDTLSKVKFSDHGVAGDRRLVSDEALVGAILSNLLNNAVSYSSPGTEVQCALSQTMSNRLMLEISNVADNLEAKDTCRIAEPFWRKDEARSRSGKFGLGLTLVESYARLIGANVSFEYVDTIFTATVEFEF